MRGVPGSCVAPVCRVKPLWDEMSNGISCILPLEGLGVRNCEACFLLCGRGLFFFCFEGFLFSVRYFASNQEQRKFLRHMCVRQPLYCRLKCLSLSLQVALRITVLNYVTEKRSNLRLVDRYGSVWAWLPFSSLKLSRDNTDCRLLLSPTSC